MEGIEGKVKLDAHLITIPSGTAAGALVEREISLDESYDECIGIEGHEVSDGGSAYYQVRVSDQDRAYVELAHKNVLLTSSSVPQDLKSRRVNFTIISGRKIKVAVKPGGLLASDLKIELVFSLLKRTVKV